MPLVSVQEILNAHNDFDVDVPRWEAANYNNITTSAQTTVKSAAGVLVGITINASPTSAVRCYDNTVSGGSVLLTIPASVAVGTNYRYGLKFSTGLTVSSGSSNTDITVMYL